MADSKTNGKDDAKMLIELSAKKITLNLIQALPWLYQVQRMSIRN